MFSDILPEIIFFSHFNNVLVHDEKKQVEGGDAGMIHSS